MRLYECLHDDGIPVTWDETGGEGQHLRFEVNELEWKFPESSQADAVLWINGTDYSTRFGECLALSGYVAPPASRFGGDELEEKQAYVLVNNEWAACARSHGFPALPDSSPAIVDGGETMPTVLLPSTISEQELRELLVACPNSPGEVPKVMASASSAEALDGPLSYTLIPEIGFDWPGFNGVGGAVELIDPTSERLLELQRILSECASEHLDDVNYPSALPT
jgi:hypothetical protein